MIGNVIFHQVPKRVIDNLMSGKLPSLAGNYPMSVTLCLRLMILVEEVRSQGKASVHAKNDTLVRCDSFVL